MRYILSCFLALILTTSAQAGLTISLNFGDFDANAPTTTLPTILRNDGWSGSTSSTTRLTAAKAAMVEAASQIQTVFAGVPEVLNRSIDVGWASHGGDILARGGASWFEDGSFFGNGTLNWDNDTSSTFFVDTTPTTNTEWGKTSQRSMNLGQSINVENIYYNANTSSEVFDNSDMVSVAIHEMYHALGFLGTDYPLFAALDPDTNGELDLTATFAAGNAEYDVAYSGGHTSETLAPPEKPGYPADGWSIGGDTIYPNTMGPSTVRGVRKLQSDLDVLMLANIHSFGATDFSTVAQPFGTISAVPEPSALLLTFLTLAAALPLRRRRADRV